MTTWLMLIVALPTHPSSLRVRAWRKLRALGAVALKNSVWVLPFSPERLERLQWLTQEIQKDRGEATLVRVDRLENMSEADVVRLFHEAREADYRTLATRYRASLRGLGRRARGAAAGRAADELARLARELERVREMDFFEAPGYQEVDRLRATADMHLRPPAPERAAAPLPDLRGRLWATRPRPHIDRLASAWLIRRFIDPDARFLFAPPAEFPPEAVPFDVMGAEFGHQGEDVTFETLLKRGGLEHAAPPGSRRDRPRGGPAGRPVRPARDRWDRPGSAGAGRRHQGRPGAPRSGARALRRHPQRAGGAGGPPMTIHDMTGRQEDADHAPGDHADPGETVDAERTVRAAHRQPLREHLRRRRADPERRPRGARRRSIRGHRATGSAP